MKGALTELLAFLNDAEVGRLEADAQGRIRLVYETAWRTDPNAVPLSVSMPLTMGEHGHDVVSAYLWGLLPDNEIIIEAWAKRFRVSARSPLALLANVGEDCPGAARFVRPARRGRLSREGVGAVDWLDDAAIAGRLRALRKDVSAWRADDDAGQFSLGGAQPKTALHYDGKRWGVPSGRIPTTHILKPGAADLAGHAENEHFCLALAREAGLPAAASRIVRFEEQIAIAVQRYDRIGQGKTVRRVHQEDCCQALGVPPASKYESAGGPGASSIAALLRERSRQPSEDLDTLIDALAFNWAIAGTDAHAKNYSVLIGRGGEIRLAPLYDLASYLPYAGHETRRAKLAMKIGGKYRLREIGVYQWTKLARELGRDPDEVASRVATLCATLADRTADVLRSSRADGLAHASLAPLAAAIQERARACARMFE